MFMPPGCFTRCRNGSIHRRIDILRFLCMVGYILSGVSTAMASHVGITFEETITTPANVVKQYCTGSANKGVEFISGFGIMQPPVPTSSGTHALMENPGDDVNPFSGPLVFRFTIGQSHVGVMVGLDRNYPFPVTALLRAYDDPEPGAGTKLTSDFGPAVVLGNGPIAITAPLNFSTPTGEPIIRRVEIEFLGPIGNAPREIIDDLTFGEIGPPCVTDTQSPIVNILQPTPGQTFNTPEILLHYRAQDVGTGIASIRVAMLGPGGTELSSTSIVGERSFPIHVPDFLRLLMWKSNISPFYR